MCPKYQRSKQSADHVVIHSDRLDWRTALVTVLRDVKLDSTTLFPQLFSQGPVTSSDVMFMFVDHELRGSQPYFSEASVSDVKDLGQTL